MGSMPKLLKKIELRYRKGLTNEGRNCRYCAFFSDVRMLRRDLTELWGPYCLLMGVVVDRRYRIRGDYTCDAQRFDEGKKTW